MGKHEKNRLQELVKAFAKRALAGESCDYIDDLSGTHYIARYSLDARLEHFVVNFSSTHMECLLADIDAVHVLADGEGHFSSKVLKGIDEESRGRLCVVVCGSPGVSPNSGAHRRIHLLLRTELARDDFKVCLKVLRLYALQGSVSDATVWNSKAGSSIRSAATSAGRARCGMQSSLPLHTKAC